jgi:regulatory protein
MEKNKALAKAMEYCARSEKSPKEVLYHLETIGTNPSDMDEIIVHLKKEGFIDESRYARSYVADKYRFNSWGKQKIRYQLQGKGIPGNIIKDALDTLDPDEYYDNLKDQIEKKLSSLKGDNKYQKKAKLIRFAAARGYESDLIYMAVDEILK